MSEFIFMAPRKSQNQVPPSFPAGKRLLDANGVAAVFGISVRTVDRMVIKGELPTPVKVNGQRRWREQDILDALDDLFLE